MDPKAGLSRFRPDGLGIPPETEATHILEPFAAKHGLSILEFSKCYNDETLKEPALDEYFLHDRAVRGSGHDTTYRFEKRCAELGTIDLQVLPYGSVSTLCGRLTRRRPPSWMQTLQHLCPRETQRTFVSEIAHVTEVLLVALSTEFVSALGTSAIRTPSCLASSGAACGGRCRP